MKTFKIENDDLQFDGQNDLQMVEGQAEVSQSIERVLSTNLGEWFLNIEHGLDFDLIRDKMVEEERKRVEIIRAIGQDPRFDELKDLTLKFDRKERHLHLSFTAKMKSGEIVEVEEVLDID